jgi:hypothetical protein
MKIGTSTEGNDMDYHEGQPSILLTANRVVVLCPAGHVIESMPVKDWARSGSEARFQGSIVRCCGTISPSNAAPQADPAVSESPALIPVQPAAAAPTAVAA